MKKLLLLFTFLLLAAGFALTANAAVGDADGNNKISAADARYVLRAAVRLEHPDDALRRKCDVDHDGAVTASDARLVLRVAVKLDKFTHPALTGNEPVVRMKPATCTAPGETAYQCACGDLITVAVPAKGHVPAAAVTENYKKPACDETGSYDAVVYCKVCKEELSRTNETIPTLPHTPGDETEENRVETTCAAPGGYDTAVYCTVCGNEVSRVHTEIPALPHTPGEAVTENDTPPTCAAVGGYDTVVYCTVCKNELSRAHTEVETLPHTPGEAVTENETPPTCAAIGGYDTVVYCTVCGNELSREHTDVDKLPHTPGEETEENRVEPTCAAPGGYDTAVYCTECGILLYRIHTELAALPHTPGDPVKENIVETSCTGAGGYDTVVYCTVCENELSRAHTDIPMLSHEMTEILPEAYIGAGPIYTGPVYYCALCGLCYTDAEGKTATEGYYNTLAAALAAAEEGDTVALVRDVTLTEDLTVPAGVTLLLPYAPGALIVNDAYQSLPYASAAANDAVPAVTPAGEQVSVTLTLSGCTLTVDENALLCIGGQYSGLQPIGGGTYGSHAELQIEADASLLIKGTLSAYGYITGEGEASLQGGTLYMPLIVTDYHGGTYSAIAYAMETVSPFNSIAAVNVQCPLVMDSAASVYGYYALYANETHNTSTGALISADEGLLRLSEGASLRFTYHPEVAVEGFPGVGRTEIEAEGDITVQSFQMRISYISVRTADVQFPVSWNFGYTQKTGVLTVSQALRLLPGSALTVGPAAKLNVLSALHVMDGFAPQLYSAATYPAGTALAAAGLPERARLIVDGEMTVADGAAFTGIAESNGTGTIVLAENAILTATLTDGVLAGERLLTNITAQYTNKTAYACTARIINAEGAPVALTAGHTYTAAPAAIGELAGYSCVRYTGTAEEFTEETVDVTYTAPQKLAGMWEIYE